MICFFGTNKQTKIFHSKQLLEKLRINKVYGVTIYITMLVLFRVIFEKIATNFIYGQNTLIMTKAKISVKERLHHK